MDSQTLVKILKRRPHIELMRIVRPNDIGRALTEAHPELSDDEKREVREQINIATVLAASAHEGVLRKSGEPYITHPFSVAYFLAKMGMDVECVIAGILHDTVEDTTTTLSEIAELFGKRVENLVDGITKLTSLHLAREEKQAIAFQKLITFAADDIRVIFIKLLDRLHNMMTIDFMSPEQKKRISEETLRFYAPLAHRLGIYWLKEELESLSFYHLQPEEWKQIDDFIREKYTDPTAVLEKLQDKVREAIRTGSPKACERVGAIYGRIKSYFSIYNKTIRQNKSVASLHDIIGIRVIIDSEDRDDCYLVMAAIHSFSDFTVMNDRFKDYISRPKLNGYTSIHTVVRFREYSLEIQIRTRDMHRIAEEGDASHWAYKNEIPHRDKVSQWLQQVLKDLIDSQNAVNFMHDIETALPLEKITVFTPKGDLITLPEGATVLDFAYAIHGDLGDTCVGATVNGKKVPIYFKLQNRDEVTIDTSRKQEPRSDWLTFVTTHKAKQYIRRHIQQQEKQTCMEKGRETIKQIFEYLGRSSDFNRLEELEGFSEIADKYSLPKTERMNNFFLKITTGEIKLRAVITLLFASEEVERLIEGLPKKVAPLFPERLKIHETQEVTEVVAGTKSVYIRGIGEVKEYGAAKCCNPEEGDPIAAYISQTRGYIVHKSECPSLTRLENARIEKGVFWYTYPMYLVEFIIEIKNTPGALLEVIQEISSEGLNITSLHINPVDAAEKSGHVLLSIKGTDIRQIDELNRELKNKRSIISYSINNITMI